METTEIKTIKKSTDSKCKFKAKTQDEFIQEAREIHKDENGEPIYLYDKTVYVSTIQKIIITCKIHGDFELSPKTHKEGRGCSLCSRNALSEKFKSSKEEFIRKAILRHHDEEDNQLFDYDEVVYVNSETPVIITCNNGHRFEQTPLNHLKAGCSECSGKFKYNTESFIKKAQTIHKDDEDKPLFDYHLVEYKTSRTYIIIICKKGHQFEIKPHLHLEGKGCQECDKLKKKEMKK